jgi:hypothetical protein
MPYAIDASHNRIEFVKRQLHGWIDELLNSPDRHDLKKSFGKALTIRNYVLSPVLDPHEMEIYLEDPEVQDYMARHQALWADNEMHFEQQMSGILCAENDNEVLVQIIKEYYANIYRALTCTEIFLSDMNTSSTVVMVGTGSMPLSLLFMQRFSNAHILGLDHCKSALDIGGQYIDYLTMKYPENYRREAIELICMDGATFDYSKCNIIILSIHISNRAEVIKRIIETAPCDRQVIVIERQVQGLRQYFYHNYSFDPAGLPMHKVGTLCSSLLHSTAYRLEWRGSTEPSNVSV